MLTASCRCTRPCSLSRTCRVGRVGSLSYMREVRGVAASATESCSLQYLDTWQPQQQRVNASTNYG